MGAPQFQPVPGARLMFAVNTNWVVLMDPTAGQYYLLVGDSWLTAPDPLAGPWFAAGTTLPADFSKLPSADHWDSVKEHVPGSPFAVVPNVITSKVPAELIVTNGPPSYTPIAGTRLMYVSNPTTPLFLDLADFNYYFLVAGRWFRAPKPAGPWAAASAELPAEFAKIPPASPVGFVLSAVPHTQEADDAVLLASVAHKATITTDKTTVEVTYQGAPKFVEIPGTSMTYAVNTPYEVVFAGGQYYCCHQAVWFTAPAPTGPWTVCAQVPAVIYTIPPTCPIYNVTYVRVYGSTPTTVIVGYTGGYCGEYVATTGALMFGAGMALGVAIANNNDWCCYPLVTTPTDSPATTVMVGVVTTAAAARWYGPHGGCGWGACYNPATGTYARGGFAYGPDGAHWGRKPTTPGRTPIPNIRGRERLLLVGEELRPTRQPMGEGWPPIRRARRHRLGRELGGATGRGRQGDRWECRRENRQRRSLRRPRRQRLPQHQRLVGEISRGRELGERGGGRGDCQQSWR